jgi:hypothetical protein
MKTGSGWIDDGELYGPRSARKKCIGSIIVIQP